MKPWEINLVRCPESSQKLSAEENFLCSPTGHKYPVLWGRVPLLVADPQLYIVTSLLTIQSELNDRTEQLLMLETRLSSDPIESKSHTRFIERALSNNKYYMGLCHELAKYTSVNEAIAVFARKRALPKYDYMLNSKYLVRDWSNDPVANNEISDTVSRLKDWVVANSAVLLVGGGAGRMAYELSMFHPTVVNLDHSILYASVIEQIVSQGRPIYSETTKSQHCRSEMIRDQSTHLPLLNKFRNSPVFHLIGDARSLPFNEASFDSILSVYFTDVIPFTDLIRESKRVLRDGGRFIHYGPLDFHFRDLADHISLEEMIEEASKLGINVLHLEEFTETHCATEHSASVKTYRVWLLVLEKQSMFIDDETIIKVNTPLVLSEIRNIGGPNQTTSIWELSVSGITYKNGIEVMQLLELMDGTRKFGEVIRYVKNKYEGRSEEIQSMIHEIVVKLLDRQALKIVDPKSY